MFARRSVLFAVAALGLVPPGCGDGPTDLYDPGWRHTLRPDPIVLRLPDAHPTGYPPPGEMNEYLLDLPQRGGKILKPADLPESVRSRLTAVMDEAFGTPADPRMPTFDSATMVGLGIDPESLRKASASYKARCVNCHGMSGDGRGPSAPWTTPYPRDFRNGKFKAATGPGIASGRPRFDDLARVLRYGVPGTPMVATGLSDEEIRLLVGYTIHLSVRGEVEMQLLRGLVDSELQPTDLAVEARHEAERILKLWQAAQGEPTELPPIPDRPDDPSGEYAESVRRGHQLFATAGCLSCHERYGKTATYRTDVWGLPNLVRNLSEPERRWARSDVDVARQIRFGIAAANMPGSPALNDRELVDLVNFTRELPYPKRLPPDVQPVVENPPQP